jgi:cysteine sulfinate desulfinase/cysteine desulfurase-like protein
MALYHYHTSKAKFLNQNVTPRVITSSIEHPAILAYLKHLESRKEIELIVVGVSTEGLVCVSALKEALTG